MRGDVHRYKAPRDRLSHEQAGPRYAVVVQSDDLPLSTWLVVPTSTSRAPGPIRPDVMVAGEMTRVLTDHLVCIDPEARLGEVVGHLTHVEMQAVDAALRLVLSLD